ncbi:MAG: BMP family protein [Pseudorhodobacter sp.]
MTLMKSLAAATAIMVLSTGMTMAEPALIFDLGGKFDKSFNESAYEGAQRWAKDTGNSYKELEIQSEAQREQFVRRMAETGANPIVVMSFSNIETLNVVAPDFPDTKFVLIDGVAEQPNVRSVIFAEHEGSYLVGMLAALASKTGTVGFVGGMDVPLIRRFGCGYAEGVKAVNPDAKIIANMTGTTGAAWNDPVKGSELAKSQISQGADVIFAAAGGTGLGVLQAAADGGILSIGVDSNQNHLHPGKVLTSMLKRVDNAVYGAFEAGDALETGQVTMDIAAQGVGYALDDNNAELITDEMKAAADKAAEKIAAGEIAVHDYYVDSNCPSVSF